MKFAVNAAPVLKIVKDKVYELVIVSAVDEPEEAPVRSKVYCREAGTGYTALLTLTERNTFKAVHLARALKIKGTLDTQSPKIKGKTFMATLTAGNELAFVDSIRQ